MLDLKNISKTFNPGTVNEKVALENVNLHLDDGDFATIVGSNGAGKSTLFNAIAGEFIADTGTITLDGRDITFLPDFKRSKAIGRMFQDPLRGTAPHMTIEENLALAFLRASGHTSAFSRINKKDRELFAEKLSALGLGLEDRMKQPIEQSTENVEIFDTAIAIMAGLMIIPAVFAFSGGAPDTLQAGPALMFITIPKVFASMGMGTAVGVLFFVLVLFAALTSSIALTESAVSTFEDELGWDRTRSTILIGCIMITLGSLSALGYGPLASVTVFGMQFLDFFDFLTNSVMMPIAAIATCLLVSRIVGVEKIEEEVTREGQPFRRKPVFNFMLRYLCPIFAAIILASSVANALGWIAM